MHKPAFSPGFRFSPSDGFVLVIGVAGTVLASRIELWMGGIVAFTVGHFFLFCNIFRMARALELAWTAVFLTLAACTMTLQQPGWPLTFGTSLIVTVAVVAIQMRRPAYHGVGWRRINPNLLRWWQAQSGSLQ